MWESFAAAAAARGASLDQAPSRAQAPCAAPAAHANSVLKMTRNS
jgi:hypothetical protein